MIVLEVIGWSLVGIVVFYLSSWIADRLFHALDDHYNETDAATAGCLISVILIILAIYAGVWLT